MYLSIPLRLIKFLEMDTTYLINLAPYLAHLPVVILTDYYTWKVSKRVIGHDASRISMIFLFFNRFQTMHITRTLTNGLEQMFTIVAFYFYLNQKNKFTFSTVVLTALISFAFMMRNTSPVGWLPLLAIKVLKEGAFVPFLISGIFVALPILFGCVWMDTLVYGSDKWVFTGYNFLEMNLLHGLSKYFGEDGPLYYIVSAYPSIFVVLVPIALIATFTHIKYQWSK